MKRVDVGGQAVIEGVMMKNQDTYSVAIRKPNQEIIVEKKTYVSYTKRYKIFGLPFIRGIVAFLESMVQGTKILTYSAEFYEVEEEESKFDRWLSDKLGDKTASVMIAISVILAMGMALGLFVLLPLILSQLLSSFLDNTLWVNAFDGFFRIAIFLTYLGLISKMKDIQRVFQYHGAEHKSIHCLESGLDLTVDNVKKMSRLHKRCGTTFILYVIVISVLVLTLINVQTFAMRLLVRLILLPLIAGVSYELLKFFGHHDHPFVNSLSKPGLMLQRLTTKEPDGQQIEVAIASLKSALDMETEDVYDLSSKPAAV